MSLAMLSDAMTEKILFTYGPGGFFAVISIAILVYFMRQDKITIKELLTRADARDAQFLAALDNNTKAMNGFAGATHDQAEALARLEYEVRQVVETAKSLPVCAYQAAGYVVRPASDETLRPRKPQIVPPGKDIKVDMSPKPA